MDLVCDVVQLCSVPAEIEVQQTIVLNFSQSHLDSSSSMLFILNPQADADYEESLKKAKRLAGRTRSSTHTADTATVKAPEPPKPPAKMVRVVFPSLHETARHAGFTTDGPQNVWRKKKKNGAVKAHAFRQELERLFPKICFLHRQVSS